MANKIRQMYAEEWIGHRTCMFKVTARQNNDGGWNINMIGDYVPTEDMFTMDDPIAIMVDMHNRFIAAMEARNVKR